MNNSWTNSKSFKMLQECPFFEYSEDDFAGIYKIENLENGKVYIGQSRDIFKRIVTHKNELLKNNHSNSHLQKSWNRYGAKCFIFEIIEYCSISDLYSCENKWVLYYNSYDSLFGYNKTIPNQDATSFTHSKEVRERISENTKKYSDDELISYLQEFYYMEGRVPTIRDLDSSENNYPSACLNRFGGLQGALIKADIYSFTKGSGFDKGKITRESILSSIGSFVDKNHYFPEAREMTPENNLYSYSSIKKVFKNGLEEIKEQFGYDKETVKHLEQLEALACLKEIYDENGFVSDTLIDCSNKCKGRSYFQRSFGSFTNAYRMVGINPDKNLQDSLSHYNSLRKS
ncbi:homing endonuclease associated repeat-containing protein [Bacillus sp. FJAT-22090]|uniref:homing endonuclease associated repeat-containing protein n=1 Tax=Bacillus sp. FJAT-22090 TaxID=1581038 RepID=UPI001642DBE4|nr:GIY-YIG nuclease family protein [Bacillus sp. FJAT-22090]